MIISDGAPSTPTAMVIFSVVTILKDTNEKKEYLFPYYDYALRFYQSLYSADDLRIIYLNSYREKMPTHVLVKDRVIQSYDFDYRAADFERVAAEMQLREANPFFNNKKSKEL